MVRSRKVAQTPGGLSSFKHFYELQNQKLELQKQNLLKIQKLQKQKSKLRYEAKSHSI